MNEWIIASLAASNRAAAEIIIDCMMMLLAQFLFLADAVVGNPAPVTVVPSAVVAGAPTSQPTQLQLVVRSDPRSPIDQTPAFEAFEKTRLFQLAEGKQTTSLDQMLKPGFWIDTIKELIVAAVSFIPRLLVSLLFMFVFWLIYRAVRRVLVGAMHKANVDPSIRDMMVAFTKWGIMGFGLVIACNQLGIPIVAMLTGVSILGLAVGFAAQETLANFIAGVVIFWDKPFKAADWLTVDGTYGQVQRITFRSCRLLNLDGEIVIFPNTFMLASKVANHTTHPMSRVSISIGIAYRESIEKARAELLKCIHGDRRIMSEPHPEVVVDKCSESSVDLILRFWINDDKIERRITYEYNEKVKNALDSAGIEIPFPQRQLLLDKLPLIQLATSGQLEIPTMGPQ